MKKFYLQSIIVFISLVSFFSCEDTYQYSSQKEPSPAQPQLPKSIIKSEDSLFLGYYFGMPLDDLRSDSTKKYWFMLEKDSVDFDISYTSENDKMFSFILKREGDDQYDDIKNHISNIYKNKYGVAKTTSKVFKVKHFENYRISKIYWDNANPNDFNYRTDRLFSREMSKEFGYAISGKNKRTGELIKFDVNVETKKVFINYNKTTKTYFMDSGKKIVLTFYERENKHQIKQGDNVSDLHWFGGLVKGGVPLKQEFRIPTQYIEIEYSKIILDKEKTNPKSNIIPDSVITNGKRRNSNEI
ncbi:MAG: hypothetical protein WC044_11900 [Crocinitomicaceae bacterium]